MVFSRFLILLTTLFITSQAFAQISITNVNTAYSRATGKLVGDATTTTVTTTTLLGGVSGTCTGSTSSSSTCNSCADGTAPCNTRRIHNDLIIEITFTFTDSSGKQGPVRVTTDLDDGEKNLTVVQKPSGDITSGSSITIGIQWSEICDKLFGGGSCNDASTLSNLGQSEALRIGVDIDGDDEWTSTSEFSTELRFTVADIGSATTTLCDDATTTDPNGPCNFLAYPGDSKIFLEEVQAGCSFPQVDGSDSEIQALRVFYTEDSTNAFPTFETSTFKDIELTGDSSSCSGTIGEVALASNEVDGLTNGTLYRFAIGALDEANNLGMVTDNSGSSDDPNDNTTCFNQTDEDWPLNCFMATPSEVIGLIEEEFDCFITTATYGTAFRPKVEVFRAFRNRFLKSNWIGQKIINSYYKVSPPIAHWIRNNPNSKPVMRFILWPLWFFAKACLEYPLIILMSLLTLLALVGRKTFKKGGLL